MAVFCYILNVGQGNAAVVQGENGVALIDAGPGDHVIWFLAQNGINRIDTIIISHADADHIGGLMAIIAKIRTDSDFSVGKVYVNPDSRGTDCWEDVASALYDLDLAGKIDLVGEVGVGSPGPLDLGRCTLEMLGPSKYVRLKAIGGRLENSPRPTANSMSAVVCITYEDKSWIVLPGDLDNAGLSRMLEEQMWRQAPAVVFPHHGGRAGTENQTKQLTSSLIAATQPQIVLFSMRDDTDKFPSRLVIDAILSLSPQPSLVCIGRSPVLAAAIEENAHQQHRNGFGTAILQPPDAHGVVAIATYIPPE